jgi:hypothetical protein
MKYIFSLLILFSLTLLADDICHINQKAFFIKHDIAPTEFYRQNKNYIAVRADKAQKLESHQVDSLLRSMDNDQLEKFLGSGAGYISVHENNGGEISLKAHVRGLGGGPAGATAGVIVGKFLTYGICYGGIYVASLVAGPGSSVVALAAGKTASPFIELLSNKVAISCGILGAILTGPA